jgi:hypothetical protein
MEALKEQLGTSPHKEADKNAPCSIGISYP